MNQAYRKIDQYDDALCACIERALDASRAGNRALALRCELAARSAERNKDAWIARAIAQDEEKRERALDREELWKEAAVHDD